MKYYHKQKTVENYVLRQEAIQRAKQTQVELQCSYVSLTDTRQLPGEFPSSVHASTSPPTFTKRISANTQYFFMKRAGRLGYMP